MADVLRSLEIQQRLKDLHIKFNSHVLTDAAHEIGTLILCNIDDRYGPGGSSPKTYHNTDHTLFVAKAGYEISRAAHRSHRDQAVVVFASLFHDYFQDETGKWQNERMSGDFGYETLRSTNLFDDSFCQDTRAAVWDTRCEPTEDSIGQMAETELGKFTADGDLSYMGLPTAQALEIGDRFFAEVSPGEVLESPAHAIFEQRFARILMGHDFYNPETAILYPHMRENGRYLLDLQAPEAA